MLGDIERARAIYELAIEQTRLDMPELLWKAFIDFEIGEQEYERARRLYNKLLKKTQHVKVKTKKIRENVDFLFVKFQKQRFGSVWLNLKRQSMKKIQLIEHVKFMNKRIKLFEQPMIKKNV